MHSYEQFGDLLRRFREEAGLSQNALARAAGINPTNVNRIEHSKQGAPRKTTIIKLVRGLRLSLSGERAQQLFDAAAQMARPSPPAIYRGPFKPGTSPKGKSALQPKVRELKGALLRSLELVAEIEEIIAEDEEDA